MKQKLNALYRSAAQKFARRVTSALGNKIDSVVLYGSTARGQAKRYSDVDVLIISDDPSSVRDEISTIRSDLAYETDFAIFISLAHLSRDELAGEAELGSPFIRDVMAEGVILYDNGAFSRVRERAVAASR